MSRRQQELGNRTHMVLRVICRCGLSLSLVFHQAVSMQCQHLLGMLGPLGCGREAMDWHWA